MIPIPAYFDPAANSQAHQWDSTRKHLDIARALESRPEIATLRRGEALTRAQVELAHSPAYVQAVVSGQPRALAESNDFQWCPQVDPAARAAGGQLLAAARDALDQHSRGLWGVSGAVASGFHHAEYSTGMGFCTYNALVITHQVLRAEGRIKKTLILDLDQHHGNGQMQIRSRLGLERELFHLGIPGAPHAESYRRQLRDALSLAEVHAADLLLYQAGMDPHEDDFLGGVRGMDAQALRARDAAVFAWARDRGIPVAFCMAGGYSGVYSAGEEGAENPVVALHVGTFEEAALAAAQDPARPAGA